MERAGALTEAEKRAIWGWRTEGLRLSSIPTRADRSRKVVIRFLDQPDATPGYVGNQNARKFTEPAKTRVLKKLRATPRGSLKAIIMQVNIGRSQRKPVSRGTVRRNMASDLSFRRAIVRQPLSRENRLRRVAFEMQNLNKIEEHRKVIFRDEKKFHLYGLNRYFGQSVPTGELPDRVRRHTGDGRLTFWRAISSAGKMALMKTPVRITSETYVAMLESSREATIFGEAHLKGWTLMQDNFPAHAARNTKSFTREGWHLMDRPAYLPDLNPVENVWNIMLQEAHAGIRNYEFLSKLERDFINSGRRSQRRGSKPFEGVDCTSTPLRGHGGCEHRELVVPGVSSRPFLSSVLIV
ncbi:Transposable element Tc3 transposase [Porphyridium purpureum]|uniref:Transposable element Tc3 transposase n=1 Tax=Porphyridium purpureum TaxID=35688 RepID=A0A5J4YJT7_PORPP|nr:Transposable element Tc3 transposase [Porphyridium purpureum]|eukprot:POR7305..scf270_19